MSSGGSSQNKKENQDIFLKIQFPFPVIHSSFSTFVHICVFMDSPSTCTILCFVSSFYVYVDSTPLFFAPCFALFPPNTSLVRANREPTVTTKTPSLLCLDRRKLKPDRQNGNQDIYCSLSLCEFRKDKQGSHIRCQVPAAYLAGSLLGADRRRKKDKIYRFTFSLVSYFTLGG